MKFLSFQEIIFELQRFWSEIGCCILQGYDLEMGAGTFHPATVLYPAMKKEWNALYVQTCRRPVDSRFGRHPNRVQHYYQMQVLLKPIPKDMQNLYLESLQRLGICNKHDVRFVEDDWKSPTLGANGLGWEVQCNGMEISQVTYMQQMAGKTLDVPIGEITYGLERVAMYVQKVDSIQEIVWHNSCCGKKILYGDLDFLSENEFSEFNLNLADVKLVKLNFSQMVDQCNSFLQKNLPLVAYEFCIKASHLFNLLDSRGAISVLERGVLIAKVKNLAHNCFHYATEKYKEE